MLNIESVAFLDWEAISLEINAGEIVAILGGSGSGKSLLLRAVSDLIKHEGNCSLEGEQSSNMTPTKWRRSVGYLAAEALWWEDTVGEHFLKEPPVSQLTALGLPEDACSWAPSRLSMGERQRLGVLRMLNREPKALLLDEPTSNLDSESMASIESLLIEYIEVNNAPTIWVTHDRTQASRVASRVFEMKDKQLKEVMV